MITEQIRLLICKDCKTIESLPDFDGPPEHDALLHLLVRPHKWPTGTEHLGQLAKVDKSDWDAPHIRAEIVKRLTSDTETGLGNEFYATRDTFAEDALKCFRAHHRNPDCNDYQSDAKRLTPDTAAERKELGMPQFHTANDQFLCTFCPVQTYVDKKRWDKQMKMGTL